jgi:hypothetical protein
MGWDVKATADTVLAAVETAPGQASQTVSQAGEAAQAAASQVGSAIAAHPGSFLSFTFAAIVLMTLGGLLWRMRHRLANSLEETMFANWRLALLGATGIVLSLASGYTTWDGMRNFTGEPVLSGMVTFGIQGVMLIVAWLIGESFAIGMSQQTARNRGPGSFGLDPFVSNIMGAGIGIALFVAILALFMQSNGQVDVRTAASSDLSWAKFGDKLLIVVASLLAIALVALYAASDLVKPYLQSGRVIVKNSVLWIMFLACMGTSVFFSFDSLFTSIFPQSERVRAAELRAQNQVAGILADIEQKITDSRLNEAQSLFQTPGWAAYDGQLGKLGELSREAAPQIEKYFNDQIEERNRAIKQQQERMTTAQSGQAGLGGRKQALAEELLRLKGERPTLAADYSARKSDMDAKSKEVDAKRVEAMAEAGGVEGTGKEGKGPMYRQRVEELSKLQAAIKIGEERVNDAKKRLATVETRIVQIEREQSALDGDLAKLKGEAETAEQRIKMTQEQLPSDANSRIDPSRITPAFEGARADFRQEPTQERLAKVQQLCAQIFTAMVTATPQTKKQVAGIDCDPKGAAEAASIVFALNAGTENFGKLCKGGEKLAVHTSADALFGFSRKCLADSGLPSKETDQLRTKINFIELNRDDKAHRFVVTWNAFQDGNRLAYLALAIAIAIDSLVFMSGLFGANAVRSPLSDVPSFKARTAQQLEATINAALGKLPYETAALVLKAMRPTTNTDGFSATIDLEGMDKPAADRIRVVLTAGADIHAVEAISQNPERYRVRSELREYLSVVCDKQMKNDPKLAQRARLEQMVADALKPHILEHADIVISHLDPIKPVDGFTSTVSIVDLAEPYDARLIRRVMNAGATLSAVAPDEKEQGRFYVRPDLYQALLMLSAHSPRSATFEADRRRFYAELAAPARNRASVHVGVLDGQQPRVAAEPAPRALQAPEPPSEPVDMPEFLMRPADRRPPPLPVSEDAARHREFTASLIAALGVHPNAFFTMSGAAFGAAAASSEAFARARRTNQLLDNELTQRDEEARVGMDNAFYALESQLGAQDSLNRQRLKDAFQDVDQNWPILMLLPNGPYERLLAELIEGLEPLAADGALSQREISLLASAKQLRQALAANPRNCEAAWHQLGLALTPQPGQHAQMQPGAGGKQTLQ